MTLQKEIDKKRKEIHTDSYSMSIGELINLYRDGEIDVHPEFQRFFRWSAQQRTDLIESILLGIPLPPIFVYQREDGVWDVIDGIQRLSTIFQLVGALKDEDKKKVDPLVLEKAKYLPSLEGKVWQRWAPNINAKDTFSKEQQLFIKRSKLDVTIILRQSDEDSKYELFQRLNRGGSLLSDQEVRNCILVMLNRDFFKWLQSLSAYSAFQDCIALSDRAIEERYDMELALRFLVFHDIDEDEIKNIGDLNAFLSRKMISIAKNKRFDFETNERVFKGVFDLLSSVLSADSFRRYDSKKKKFLGGFSVSAFEVVAFGIGYSFDELDDDYKNKIEQAVKELWNNNAFLKSSGSGVRASSRIPKTVPIGREVFGE